MHRGPRNCVSASPRAEEVKTSVKAVQGKAVRIGAFSDLKPDCTPWPAPEVRVLEQPQYGTVSVSAVTTTVRTNEKCGARTAPVSTVTYTSKSDYAGDDKVRLEVISKDAGPQPVSVAISVGAKSASAVAPALSPVPTAADKRKLADDAAIAKRQKLADEKIQRTEAMWKRAVQSICVGCLRPKR
jgi:hypothetical protein